MARIIDWGAAELAAACLSSDRGRRGIHCAPFSHLQSSSPWWRSTWRVLLASRAGGADATSQIGEYLNLSISQLHYSVESLDRVFPCLPDLRAIYEWTQAASGRASRGFLREQYCHTA